ncbi:MAG: hypothetical protein RSF79_23455, partial [Janthinobacterium sp.]
GSGAIQDFQKIIVFSGVKDDQSQATSANANRVQPVYCTGGGTIVRTEHYVFHRRPYLGQ